MIDQAMFGRTGHSSTRVVFGAAALAGVDQDTADKVIATVTTAGVNHIDTAAAYGVSELRLASWLSVHRREVFLATKTGERSGDGARGQLESSLERMGVDHVDLVQMHNLVEEDEWEAAHGPGGALAALVRARDEGLTRHIGVTGHGLRIPRMHIRGLERFDFDSVLFPYNHSLLADDRYRRDVDELREICADRQVAVQTIKSVARRRWPDDATGRHRSWYEPLTEVAAVARAVSLVLSQSDLFLCTSSDFEVLPAILEAGASPGPPPSHDELAADAAEYGVRPLFDGADLERI